MPKSYKTGSRSSAATSPDLSQICDACRAVIERAQGRRELARCALCCDASPDTFGRMLDDYTYGGWTLTRIIALRDWEEREYRTVQIRTAMAGSGALIAAPAETERDADKALVSVLQFSRSFAEFRPDGLTRQELRVLLPAAKQALDDLGNFARDADARLKGGAK